MKIILYMAQTVNGYIAKEDNSAPWSDAVWKSYYDIANSFKAIILGRKTYEIMVEVDEFKKIGNPFTVVLTHKKLKSNDKFAFVQSPQEAINLLKEKGFREVLLGGGGSVNASFMREKLVDEIILDVEPMIFGKGIKLFAECDFEANLKLTSVKNLSEDTVQLKYKTI